MVRKYKAKINVYLTDEQRKNLESIGDREGTPLSVTIRKILIDYLNNEGGEYINENAWLYEDMARMGRKRHWI